MKNSINMDLDSKEPYKKSDPVFHDWDEDIFYDCEQESSYDCEQDSYTSPDGACAAQKRKVAEVVIEEDKINSTQKKLRKSSASHTNLEILQPLPNSTDSLDTPTTTRLEHHYLEQRKEDQVRDLVAEPKTCSLFAAGKTCKNGQECKFLHSEEQRENYINKQRIKARSRLRYDQKVDVISAAELTDPQFGILVSGFGGVLEEGSPTIIRCFKMFIPGRVKWSSQFSIEERRKLQDRYSLPDIFVRMSFSTVLDQMNAITQRNRRPVGLGGPILSVQRYVPGSALLTEGNENVSRFGDIKQRLVSSKADEFHQMIQDEEEQRNCNYRLGILPERRGRIPGRIELRDEHTEGEIKWGGDYTSQGSEEDLQLASEEIADLGSFSKIDCSGISLYD